MDTLIRQLAAILTPYMSELRQELRIYGVEIGLPGRCQSGVWFNDKGILLAYISYHLSDDPARESVDGVCDIRVLKHTASLSIDISWSNGEMVTEICDQTINYTTEDDLIHQVKELLDQSRQNLLTQFENLLLTLAQEELESPKR